MLSGLMASLRFLSGERPSGLKASLRFLAGLGWRVGVIGLLKIRPFLDSYRYEDMI